MIAAFQPSDLVPWATALSAAIGVLAVAVCANYLLVARTLQQASSNGAATKAVGGDVAKLLDGAGHDKVVSGVIDALSKLPQPAGGVQPLPEPTSQLQELTVSLAPSPTRKTDCVPSCVVYCIRVLTGVRTLAELMRLLVFGIMDGRLCTMLDAQAMMRANEQDAVPGYYSGTAQQAHLIDETSRGHLVIILGVWDGPEGHAMVAEHADAQGVRVMDPWTAQYRVMGWDEFAAKSWGEVLTCRGKAVLP